MSTNQFPASTFSADLPLGNSAINSNMTEVYEFLHGDIPKGKSLIYYIQPGVEGEILGIQTAYNTLRSGDTCIFVASSTSPNSIRNQFKELGLDTDPFKNRFFFIDAYNPFIGAPSKEKYVISNPDNIYSLSKTIIELLKESSERTIVFGSLSTIMDLCGEKETIEAIKLWNKMAMLYEHILVYNFTAWPYSQETLNSIKKDLFNAVICVGRITESVIFNQYFGILKSD